jgi:hypothetical protein
MFYGVDITLEHDGRPRPETTFTINLSYSNDNITFTNYTGITGNTITFPQLLTSTLPTTLALSIVLPQYQSERLYKYYKVSFSVNQSIFDDEYTFVRIRPKNKDYS